MSDDLATALPVVPFGEDDIAHPAERGEFPLVQYQLGPGIDRHAASRADQPHDAAQRHRRPERRSEGTGQKESLHGPLPKRRTGLRSGRFECNRNVEKVRQRKCLGTGHLPIDGNRAERQQERNDECRQQQHAVETVESLAAEQHLIKEIEHRQTGAGLEIVCQKVLHGYRSLWVSISRISSLSSSTEIFSSLMSADTAPR